VKIQNFRKMLVVALTLLVLAGLMGGWLVMPSGVVNAADAIVTFLDPGLEAAIRDSIGKPDGDIYASDLVGLISLDASVRNINDLTGLEYCTNLTDLYLQFNEITDISILQNLTGLQLLHLYTNHISDISPLQNLTNLRNLDVYQNLISDISYLQNLTGLTSLALSSNQITDINVLQYLTNLEILLISDNRITDISCLQNLTKLQMLDLDFNQINDISALQYCPDINILFLANNHISEIGPLLINAGLGAGDTIFLDVNRLDITPGSPASLVIQQLKLRGASVSYIWQKLMPALSQTWYLDSVTDAFSNPIMEKSGAQNDSVVVGGATTMWVSNLQAATPVVFDDGTWVVQLDISDLAGAYSVEIGSSEGGHGFSAFHTPITGIASGSLLTLYIDLVGVSVPGDQYLALRITSTGTGSIATIGNSYLGAPDSTPSYPVPEMAAIALFALGLSGLAVYIFLKNRKAKAEANKLIS
jgi:hypothetical protein